MSREIKFRAWTGKEMLYMKDRDNNFNPEDKHNRLMYRPISSLIGDSNDYIWQQFTGLKDKNGVKIYAGDIVMIKEPTKLYPSRDYCEKKSEVKWDNKNSRFSIGFSNFPNKNMKVIGNIYENKELLKI